MEAFTWGGRSLRGHAALVASFRSAFLTSRAPDQIVPLQDVIKVRSLQQRLDDALDPAAILSAWASSRVDSPTPVARAPGLLEEGLDLARVVAQANLSVRQFRRRCLEITARRPAVVSKS